MAIAESFESSWPDPLNYLRNRFVRWSSWPQTDAGPQLVVPDIVKTTGMRTGSLYDKNLVCKSFKIGAKVHAALDGNDALFRRFNTNMPEDRLIQALAPYGTNDDANIRRRIQHS